MIENLCTTFNNTQTTPSTDSSRINSQDTINPWDDTARIPDLSAM